MKSVTCIIIGLVWILWGHDKTMSPEEARNAREEENQKAAELLVERGELWMSQPGSVTDGSGTYLNFNLNPASLEDFYPRGLGLGRLFPPGPYDIPSFEERSKLEWKGRHLRVKFEWDMGPYDSGEKWVRVCCGKVRMRIPPLP